MRLRRREPGICDAGKRVADVRIAATAPSGNAEHSTSRLTADLLGIDGLWLDVDEPVNFPARTVSLLSIIVEIGTLVHYSSEA